jgi:hypothetical protein
VLIPLTFLIEIEELAAPDFIKMKPRISHQGITDHRVPTETDSTEN